MPRSTSFGISPEKTNSRRNLLSRSFSKSLRLDKNNASDVHHAKQVGIAFIRAHARYEATLTSEFPSILDFA